MGINIAVRRIGRIGQEIIRNIVMEHILCLIIRCIKDQQIFVGLSTHLEGDGVAAIEVNSQNIKGRQRNLDLCGLIYCTEILFNGNAVNFQLCDLFIRIDCQIKVIVVPGSTQAGSSCNRGIEPELGLIGIVVDIVTVDTGTLFSQSSVDRQQFICLVGIQVNEVSLLRSFQLSQVVNLSFFSSSQLFIVCPNLCQRSLIGISTDAGDCLIGFQARQLMGCGEIGNRNINTTRSSVSGSSSLARCKNLYSVKSRAAGSGLIAHLCIFSNGYQFSVHKELSPNHIIFGIVQQVGFTAGIRVFHFYTNAIF